MSKPNSSQPPSATDSDSHASGAVFGEGKRAFENTILLPLEWDGRADSIYHPFDRAGNRHMEHVRQRGAFDDMPLAQIVSDFAQVYGRLGRGDDGLQAASFSSDVERETASSPDATR